MRSAAIYLSIVLALGSLAGCATGEPDGDEVGEVGELVLPLVATSQGGTYRLSGTFVVLDPQGSRHEVDASGTQSSVSIELEPGHYSVSINPDFILERSSNGGTFQPITAVLASEEWQSIIISRGHTTFLTFLFLIPGAAPSERELLSISFDVIQQQGQLIVTLTVHSATGIYAPYATSSPPSFTVPCAQVGGAGGGIEPNPWTEGFMGGLAQFVTNDSIGRLKERERSFVGGSARHRIDVLDDDRQTFTLTLRSADDRSTFSVSSNDLLPRVPTSHPQRLPENPFFANLRTQLPFQYTFSNFGPFPQNNTMTGIADLQFTR